MKRAFNRAIAMLLVLFIVFPMLPVSVLAEQSTTLQGVGSVHTVTFESDQPASYLVADGKSIETMPEAPEKTAADFIGWYDGETEITAPFTPQADMTIVPKYDAWDARTLDAAHAGQGRTMRQQRIDQRAGRMAGRGMHDHADGLVDDNHVGILEKNLHRNPFGFRCGARHLRRWRPAIFPDIRHRVQL